MAEPEIWWGFDPKSSRYRDLRTGKYISESKLRAIRDTFATRARADSKALAEAVVRGDITANQFEHAMREHIRKVHVAEYALGRGGSKSMTQADYGRLGRSLRDEYAYLRNFRREIEDGLVSDAALLDRAGLYTESGVGAFEQGHREAYRAAGVVQVIYYTAGDERVCSRCEAHNREIYLLSEAPDLPIHNKCRCTIRQYS